MATKKVEKKETKEFTMVDVFALWRKEGKKGTPYFTGVSKEGFNLRGFFNTNKNNPKEPDLRVYTLNDNGELSKEPLTSMWCNVSKSDKKYLTGTLAGKRIVGFINEKAENNRPYVQVYYSDEQPQLPIEEPKETIKTPF